MGRFCLVKITLVFFFLFALGLHPVAGYAQPEPLFRRLSTNYDSVIIEKVETADTLVLRSGERIRLIGLNAPTAPKRRDTYTDKHGIVRRVVDPTTTIEERALQFAKSLLEGKTVRLEFDAHLKDRDAHTLAYVFLPDGLCANTEIIRQGFAHLKISPPNTRYESELREAYREARREKRGLQGN